MDRKNSDIMEWKQTNPKSQEVFSCQSKEVAAELGICIDTLKSWLKRAGFQPGLTDKQNRNDKRQRELEAEIRALRKQLAQKDEVIDVLKKSVGIFSNL